MTKPTSALFVCLGNICRSPSAESVMRTKCQQTGLEIAFDSAGTAGYHIGESPDHRAIKVGKTLGYDLSNLQARQVKHDDFYRFDIIFAMDDSNLATLKKIQPKDATAHIRLFDNKAVADPYYGNDDDFMAMFNHIEQAADKLLKQWLT